MHIKYRKRKFKHACLTWEPLIIVFMKQAHTQFYFSYDFHQANIWLQKFTIKHVEVAKLWFPPKKFIHYSFYFDRPISCVIYWLNAQDWVQISDGKFGSFYWLWPLSLVQQNKIIFFQVISFFLAKHNSNVTCYFPNTYTTYANVDHTTNNTKL